MKQGMLFILLLSVLQGCAQTSTSDKPSNEGALYQPSNTTNQQQQYMQQQRVIHNF